MVKRFRDLPSFNGVAAGQTPTINLPADGKYGQIRLAYGTATAGGPTQANMEAELTDIRVKVNGKVQRRFSAREVFDINAYHGVAFSTGILPIIFEQHWARTVAGEDVLGWGMADVDTFTIEVDVDAGAVTPTLDATARWEAVDEVMGPIVKWRRFVVPVGAAGIVTLNTLPKIDAYYALHALSSNVTDVEVTVDGEEIFDATKVDIDELYTQLGWSPQVDWMHVDFANTARVGDALSMVKANGRPVQDFQVNWNMSGAGNFNLITETLGQRD